MSVIKTENYIAFDLETTGLFAGTDRVVEIGAVRFDASGRESGRFERLINPGRKMDPRAQAIHGISDADLADAPPARAVLTEFLAFLGEKEALLLAHNASFDAGFLGCELSRAGMPCPDFPVLDTLALARARLPHLPNHRLETLAQALGLDCQGAHRALADSLRVMRLWQALHGPELPASARVAYPIVDRSLARPAVPLGWGAIAEVISRRGRLRMEYLGGTQGPAPREISPRRFAHRGGVAYLIAVCHADGKEKAFRLDRVKSYESIS